MKKKKNDLIKPYYYFRNSQEIEDFNLEYQRLIEIMTFITEYFSTLECNKTTEELEDDINFLNNKVNYLVDLEKAFKFKVPDNPLLNLEHCFDMLTIDKDLEKIGLSELKILSNNLSHVTIMEIALMEISLVYIRKMEIIRMESEKSKITNFFDIIKSLFNFKY